MPHSILVVDDELQQARALGRMLEMESHRVECVSSTTEALDRLRIGGFAICISDFRMPGMTGLDLFRAARDAGIDTAFIIATAYGTIEQAVAAIREGVYDYIEKPVNLDILAATIERAGEAVTLRRENLALRARVQRLSAESRIIGESPQIRAVMEMVSQVAPTDATVLIRGESGTGKELVAQAIHDASQRAAGPFVKVNCATIPEGLHESELFGHMKGSFTGAVANRRGRFEQADHGTILLDEIGELPPSLQVKLLRVLQEREVEPVGGTAPHPIDVRVLAATHRDLEEMVRTGELREDLYYRIHVIPIDMPALRNREGDIRLLAEDLLAHYSSRIGRTFDGFTRDALEHLIRHRWPGNVRELQNTIERSVVLARGRQLTAQDLQLSSLGGVRTPGNLINELLDSSIELEALECELLRGALARAEGNQSHAAKLLGLSRRTLQYRASKHGLLDGGGTR